MSELAKVAKAMVARGRGILAADESTGTIEKRFKSIKVENTEENRRAYRELLFTDARARRPRQRRDPLRRDAAPEGRRRHAVRRRCSRARAFSRASRSTPAPPTSRSAPARRSPRASTSSRSAARSTSKLGAKFAKWRAVITIGPDIPSTTCIAANAHALGRYAAICQANGLVPIVEPEVLMDGDHTIERCEEVTEWTLNAVYQALYVNRVVLEESVLKPSMVIAGKDCPHQAAAEEIAARTVGVLKRCVPAAVAGIAFLSGGQGDEQATENLADDEPPVPEPAVAAHVLLRPRAAAALAQGVEGRGGERRAGAGAARAPRAHERARRDRRVPARSREEGRLMRRWSAS